MRVSVNLASRPYEDEAQFYRVWGTALALVVLITGLLIWLSVVHHRHSLQDWASARASEARLAQLEREQAEAEQILAEPQNRGTRDRSQFLNAAILRKSFSWTSLMMDLEKVVPPGLRVLSIAESVDRQNRVVLKMSVASQKRESAVELVRNLEKSPNFRSAQLTSEAHNEKAGATEPGVRSVIQAYYAPPDSVKGGE